MIHPTKSHPFYICRAVSGRANGHSEAAEEQKATRLNMPKEQKRMDKKNSRPCLSDITDGIR